MYFAQKDFHKKLLGRAGEVKAEEFLRSQGYEILERNFKTRIGEIDLIAEKDGTIVFVEVKTRSTEAFGTPAEAVGVNKRKKYALVASEYLVKHKKTDAPCRFDVIEIENDAINHITDAFSI